MEAIKIITSEPINNIINVVNVEKKVTKYKLNGEPKNTHSNRVVGVSSEVYPLMADEITEVVNLLNKKIDSRYAIDKKKKFMNWKLMFIIGINIGVRASDLRLMKWSFFFNIDKNGNAVWKDSYRIMPKKTSNKRKYVTLFFNDAVRKIITEYITMYPIKDIDDYLFVVSNKDNPITTATIWNIINQLCEECGIEKNVGSHTLRKTWGYHCWHNSEDKNKALVTLQLCFNHSSTIMTQKYIGIMDDEIKDMFNSVSLGY